MSRAAILLLTVGLFLPAVRPSLAASVTVQVNDSAGRPVADAVVAITAATTASPQRAERLSVSQRDLKFDPFVLIVPAGATVAFPNFDTVRHHVYSFSPARQFEIKLYGKDEAHSVTFPMPGIVAIGCNIHDNMSAFLFVTDTPYVAKTDATGRATIAGLPEGETTASIWHPYATAPQQRTEQELTLAATPITLTATLDLRAQRRVRHAY